MADRIVENYTNEIPAMPDALQTVLAESIKVGQEKLEAGEPLEPFTMIAVGDKLFMEPAEGTSPDQCYAAARHNVRGARGALAYALCYDGYLDTNEGVKDAIISEGGVPATEKGYAIACLYEAADDGSRSFNADPSYIGPAPNFMADLTAPGEEFENPAAEAFGENAGDIDVDALAAKLDAEVEERLSSSTDEVDEAVVESAVIVTDDGDVTESAAVATGAGATGESAASSASVSNADLGGITIDSGLIVDLDTSSDTHA